MDDCVKKDVAVILPVFTEEYHGLKEAHFKLSDGTMIYSGLKNSEAEAIDAAIGFLKRSIFETP